jgi:hypothetical protein
VDHRLKVAAFLSQNKKVLASCYSFSYIQTEIFYYLFSTNTICLYIEWHLQLIPEVIIAGNDCQTPEPENSQQEEIHTSVSDDNDEDDDNFDTSRYESFCVVSSKADLSPYLHLYKKGKNHKHVLDDE